jgi:hypothetical protein
LSIQTHLLFRNILFCFLRPSGCMIFYFYRGCFSAGYRVIPDM